MNAPTMGNWLRRIVVIVGLVAIATPFIALLESVVGVPDASVLYLVAVVISAMTAGTAAAVATAGLALLTYDLLFTEPFLTLVISDTSEWLSLVLFSFVGIVVGRLVAMQRHRTQEALSREREAQDLYAVSRVLAMRASTVDALVEIAGLLRSRAGLHRVWFRLGEDQATERTVADSGAGELPQSSRFMQMRRGPDPATFEWVQLHARARYEATQAMGTIRLRVPIVAGDDALGSLWAEGSRSATPPDATTSRLLVVVADQVGQAIRQDRLATAAAEVEIARASSALKSALVESVSHDLKTPLVSIRATAGTLMETRIALDRTDVVAAAASIDRQAERLDRIVTDILDLGRIQHGALQARIEAVEFGELIERVLKRLRDGTDPDTDDRQVEVDVEDIWVDADPVLLEQAVLNLVDNAFRHTPHDSQVRVIAAPSATEGWVRLRVEDSGTGVPDRLLPGLFGRSRRSPLPEAVDRAGLGVGLTIVRGFVEAMGGHVLAHRSELGGLCVDLELPATHLPADLVAAS